MTSTRYRPPGRGSNVAFCPIQSVALSGSTRNSQTVSGLASIASSRSTAVLSPVAGILLLLLSFDFALQRFQTRVPELLEELLDRREPLGPSSVETPGAVASLAHEPRLLQDVQVLGDRGPRDLEVRGDLTRRQLSVTDERKNLAPVRRSDRLECGLHGHSVSKVLR